MVLALLGVGDRCPTPRNSAPPADGRQKSGPPRLGSLLPSVPRGSSSQRPRLRFVVNTTHQLFPAMEKVVVLFTTGSRSESIHPHFSPL